jgi:hypothetical protein
MVIANSDGSIILSTKVDTSGINKGTESLKSQAAKLAAEYRKAGMSQSEAFKKAWSEIERTNQSTQKTTQSTKQWGNQTQKSGQQAKTAISGVGNALRSIAGYLSTFVGVYALINFGKEAVNLASDLQEVQNVVDVAFGDMSYKAEEFAKSAIENFGISELSAKRTASTYMAMAKGMGIAEDVASDMAITMTGLTADIASFYNMSQERADVILKSVYTGETETLKQLGIVMTEVNLENFAMSKGINKNLSAMTQQEKTMLRYQFVLEQTALAQGDFVRTQDSWANQTRILTERWNEMQRVFGEAFLMLGTLILPVINALVNGLTKVAEFAKVAASNIYEMFTGKKFNEQEESTKQVATNIQHQAENQKELNKEMKKTLAGFDDIQILSSKTAEATEISGDNLLPSTIGGGSTTGTTAGADTGKYQEIASAIKSTLADVLDAASKALLAVGLIVLFSGNILGGIGLIMAGAAAYVAGDTLGSENPLETLKGHLTTLEEYLVPALLGLGVLLLFLGMIPLGIGLILGGIAYWGYKEVQSEEYDTASFQDKLNVIMEAVSLGLVAIGVLLILFGHIPLGIGFLVAGKKLLDITEEKLQEGEAQTKLQKFFEENQKLFVGIGLALVVLGLLLLLTPVSFPIALGLIATGAGALAAESSINGTQIVDDIKNFLFENSELIALISGGLLILGIILCFVPGALPLAISLIAAGAVGLVTVTALNWNAIITTISAFVFENSELIALISGGLLILGILICFVNLPLGIALIVDGVAGLVTVTALNWNSIVDWVKGAWEAVKGFWNEYIAPVFTAEWWLNLGKACINGLIAGFEGGINGIIIGFESMINWIVDALNTLSFDIPDWVPLIGGESWGINIPRANFGRVSIPRLAQGAVIPPNREFLAVLGDQKQGTNIEAPLQTIVDAFNIALQNNGTGQTVKEEHYYLSETELMTILHKLVKGGERLQGNTLISSGGVY